jgi:flagellar export protein FliJ
MKKLYNLLVYVRKIHENKKRLELLSAISQRMLKEKEIEETEREKEKTAKDLSKKIEEEGIPAWYVSNYLNYLDSLRDLKRKKLDELKEALEIEEEKREIYVETKKELEIAQKLLEKIKMRELLSLLKKEEKFSDEIVLIKNSREKD